MVQWFMFYAAKHNGHFPIFPIFAHIFAPVANDLPIVKSRTLASIKPYDLPLLPLNTNLQECNAFAQCMIEY